VFTVKFPVIVLVYVATSLVNKDEYNAHMGTPLYDIGVLIM